MKQNILFEIKALYRDNFRVTGFSFGKGEKAACIVGTMRGNENQQLYACSQLVKKLKELEEKGKIAEGKEILVIPCVNPYSMNIKKRFWSVDNTDINRMFPGYSEGETTQRIAAGVFEKIKHYQYGIQFASFYMPGAFLPQIRVMKTGFENVDLAKKFGLPYVVLQNPRPFDTTTLNYNWQIWETNAFSIYTTNTSRVEKKSARQAVDGILTFLSKQGIIRHHPKEGYVSKVIESCDLVSVRTKHSGFFQSFVTPGEEVDCGKVLAQIIDPYYGTVKCEITSPVRGTVLFLHDEEMAYQNTAVIKIIPEEED